MRLLFLTNFYPPASFGGYEQWCQEVAIGLRNRGHEVMVLTSRHHRDQLEQPEPAWICRELHLEMEFASLRNSIQFFTSREAREKENLMLLRRVIKDFAPQAALIWGMWNLPRSLAALAEELLPERVVYYMGDYWPTLPSQHEFYWQAPARHWVNAVFKNFLGFFARQILARHIQPPLRFAHVLFPTQFMRDEFQRKQVLMQKTTVIYGAADTSGYVPSSRRVETQPDETLSLLFVGRLTPDKGVHTAIEALGQLVHHYHLDRLKLTIVGTGEPDYEVRLHQLAQQESITSLVTFLGPQPRTALPELYRQADIFLFTSIWAEPFGRVLVEAMASGLVVVGTAVGGAAEILIENENALIFPAGDAAGLAAQIVRLIEQPYLRQQLATAGQQTALTKFDIHRMTAEIESCLKAIAVNDENPFFVKVASLSA